MILASRKCGPPTETTTKTDEDGFYSVEPQEQASCGEAEPEYEVRVSFDSIAVEGHIASGEANVTHIAPDGPQNEDVTLPRLADVAFQFDYADGKPANDISMALSSGNPVSGETPEGSPVDFRIQPEAADCAPDSTGTCSLYAIEGASLSWTIYRRGAIYSQGNGSVHGSPTRVPISLPNAVSLSGVVRDYGGAPLQGVQVAASNEDWGVVGGTAETSIDGSYSLEVPEGAYRVSVSPHRGEAGLVGVTEQRAEIKGLQMARQQVEDFSMLELDRIAIQLRYSDGTLGPPDRILLTTGTLGGDTGVRTETVTSEGTPVTYTGRTLYREASCQEEVSGGPCVVYEYAGTPMFLQLYENGFVTEATASRDLTEIVFETPAQYRVHGEVRSSAGTPIVGAAVVVAGSTLEGHVHVSESLSTNSLGEYSVTLAPGNYSLNATAVEADGAEVLRAEVAHIRELPLEASRSGDVTEDVAMRDLPPDLTPVTVHVTGKGEDPVPGALVVESGWLTGAGQTPEGSPLLYTFEEGSSTCTTDAAGNCLLELAAGSDPRIFAGVGGAFDTISPGLIGSAATEESIHLPVQVVGSAGVVPGSVAIGSSSGTTVEAANSQSIAGAGLPQGAVALVGQVGYTVSGVPVGGTADVTLELPPGSDPTAVYKLVNGSYVNLGPMASIDGDQITLHLTDGGPGDEDGVANGVIVDPLVPVRVTSPPEIGRCLSVPNGTGARSSSKCTTAGGKKGYEWFPAVGSAKPIGRGGLNLTTSAAAVLEGISRQAITCGEAHLSAADEGLKSLGHAEVVLEGCRRGGQAKHARAGERPQAT